MFFHNWDNLLRIVVVGVLGYVGLVLLLRISGNRTLSKMNSFDLIVTVALGSTLSSGLLQKSVPLLETLLAFALLIGLQFIITWLSVRSKKVSSILKSEPQLVLRDGQFLLEAMKRVRVTEDEIRACIRQQGFSSPEDVSGAVLETNGELSVFK